MIEIGKINSLTVVRSTDVGFFLANETGDEILLPLSFIKTKPNVNDTLDVFVYTDSDKNLIASTLKPYAELNTFTYLRVTDVTDFGAFIEWGLEKDLFVPYNEQNDKMVVDEFYVIYIYLDKLTNRIVGSSRIEKFLSNELITVEETQEVDLMIFDESSLGFSVIVNNLHKGLIYHNDIYHDVFIGDELKGYVKTIREDKLIDISFQKSGFKNVLDSTEIVLEYIKKNNGFINLHDKSTPEEISIRLSMSKATFKKSIGILYRHKKVIIKPEGVYLAKEEDSILNEEKN